MSLIPTSVGIVWSHTLSGEITGCTISSFISVSIEESRQVVAFVLNKESRTALNLNSSNEYTVSILNQDQAHIARIFASKITVEQKNVELAEVKSWPNENLCNFILRTIEGFEIGSSKMFFAEVISFNYNSKISPLVYSARVFTKISETNST
jgi:flavin reductase (DIM6/NTAB) family NADH-FMN oxidoreductase RutF